MPFKVKRGLALEGGGILGIAHVGVLRKFKAWDVYQHFTHFAGASAGAIIAGVCACKASVAFIENTLRTADFASFQDDDWGFIRDSYRLLRQHGWYKGDELERWYGSVLAKLTGNANITFKQAHERYGTYLVITATEVFEDGLEIVPLDYRTFPDMPLKRAVRISAGIPVVFRSIFMKDSRGWKHEYVDGGTLYNYPIGLLDKELSPDEVIGIKLNTDADMTTLHTTNKKASKLTRKPPSSFLNYLQAILFGLRAQALQIHIKENDWARTIPVCVGNLKSTNFDLSKKKKIWLLQQGEEGTEAHKALLVAVVSDEHGAQAFGSGLASAAR